FDSLGVSPGTLTNAVLRVDSSLATRSTSAEISVPGTIPRSGGFGQSLAVLVGSGQSTEIGSIAWPLAGDAASHGALRGRHVRAEKRQHSRGKNGLQFSHAGSPPFAEGITGP